MQSRRVESALNDCEESDGVEIDYKFKIYYVRIDIFSKRKRCDQGLTLFTFLAVHLSGIKQSRRIEAMRTDSGGSGEPIGSV